MIGLPEIPANKIRYFLKQHKITPQKIFNNNFKTITIIVPCYKHQRYLEKCFESIINQTQKPNEVIFIDDHSPDNTQEIINELLQKYGGQLKIKVINNSSNFGQARSINIGCENTTSDYIMILNDDDYLYPNAVEKVMNIFTEKPEIALVGSTCTVITNDDSIDNLILKSKDKIDFDNILTVHSPEKVRLYKNYNDLNMSHSSSTFNKEAWKAAGGYYPDKTKRLCPFSDRDFQLRVGLLYPVGVLLGSPLTLWRSDSSVDSGLNS